MGCFIRLPSCFPLSQLPSATVAFPSFLLQETLVLLLSHWDWAALLFSLFQRSSPPQNFHFQPRFFQLHSQLCNPFRNGESRVIFLLLLLLLFSHFSQFFCFSGPSISTSISNCSAILPTFLWLSIRRWRRRRTRNRKSPLGAKWKCCMCSGRSHNKLFADILKQNIHPFFPCHFLYGIRNQASILPIPSSGDYL